MNSVKHSLTTFGLYMMIVPGIGLMTIPAPLLDLFALGHDQHLWTARVVGLLAFIIGSYQVVIAQRQLTTLYRVTVWQRYFASSFFLALWLTGAAGVAIVLFALVDAIGATWTLMADRKAESLSVQTQ